MPNLNGPDAAKIIRPLGCDSFIVGITGNVLPADKAYFKRCGANWVFPKPLKIPDLESVWSEYGIIGACGGEGGGVAFPGCESLLTRPSDDNRGNSQSEDVKEEHSDTLRTQSGTTDDADVLNFCEL